ncbi:MAG: baseplate protein [Candidatus Entotheonella gemina]|uniref:Baseplate protein n=1 Tax=Candidatus Entotheonella gemina TaxID=1429439 RepID=W4M5N4_9BACT|nr:MAG: baseplate protein [Candidatus Entotheonella gemina]
MDNHFLGIGWHFPLALDDDGQVKMASHEESIRQSIRMILSTSPGERTMHPDFGCDIHDLVFDVNSAATAGAVASAVEDALIEWEPRIDVLAVNAFPDPERPNYLLIEVSYQVRSTNSRFNLVYPFYPE